MTEIEQKRAHVKAAKQSRGHTCHWPNCGKQVPPAMWGCKKHWFRLPQYLRDRIWAAYVPGQEERMDPSSAYLDAAVAVEKWINDNYITQPGRER